MQLWKIILLYFYVKLKIHTTCDPSMQLLDIYLERFDHVYQNTNTRMFIAASFIKEKKVNQVCMDRIDKLWYTYTME